MLFCFVQKPLKNVFLAIFDSTISIMRQKLLRRNLWSGENRFDVSSIQKNTGATFPMSKKTPVRRFLCRKNRFMNITGYTHQLMRSFLRSYSDISFFQRFADDSCRIALKDVRDLRFCLILTILRSLSGLSFRFFLLLAFGVPLHHLVILRPAEMLRNV